MKRHDPPPGTRVIASALDAMPFNLLCVTVLCVLAAHAPHMPAWYTAALVAILAARWWQRRQQHRRVTAWLRIVMLAAIPASMIAVYGSPLGQEPGAAIVCGLLVLKVMESESIRDARMAVGFACFILMSALLFDQSLGFTIVVGIMLLPALATLRTLEPGLSEPRWLRAFKPGMVMLAASLPAALLGFLLIPRLDAPLWGSPGSGVASTGISDRMAPGDLQQLLTNNAVAMRIGFDGAPPPEDQRYFRGVVLWSFDGRAWLPGVVATRRQAPAPVDIREPVIHYDVTLLASHQHWMFALDVPLDTPEGALMGPDRTLWSVKPIDQTVRYRVASATDYRLTPEGLDPRVRQAALELPQGFDPRARALAARWRAQAGANDEKIVRDALQLFHNGGFAYDLDAPPLGRNSIDDFLFDTRTGFCEHYASAFTFLMRAAGIPARVVIGYQGGYWNDFAHYLLIRQSNAHSWSEIWLAGRGWVRVDPTAAVSKVILADADGATGGIDGGGGSWWLPWRNRLDVINRWWGQTVMGFDALKQAHLFRPFGIDHASVQMLGIALAITVFLALGAGALLASLRPRNKPRDALGKAQLRLQRRLARLGIARGSTEGPRDFYSRTVAALPDSASTLRDLSTEYLVLRYAYSEPPPERTRAFRRRIRHFRPRHVVK
ncbi:MAG: transglutaminaseTgpA domain-containing protein [Rhodanobacteraceae bacterium]